MLLELVHWQIYWEYILKLYSKMYSKNTSLEKLKVGSFMKLQIISIKHLRF